MRWVAFSLAAMAPLFAGCSTHPLPEDVAGLPTSAIVRQIRCEARRAVVDYSTVNADAYGKPIDYRKRIDYKTASVAYEFTFDITEGNNASADAAWILPYSLGGAFTLGASAGANRARHATRNFRIVDTFDELIATNCSREARPRDNIIYPVAGDIGIYEVVKTFIEMQQVDNTLSGEVFTFHDTLIYTTTMNAGVTPRIVMTPLTDRFRLVGASADLSASRTDIHQVVLALAGDPPKSRRTPMGSSLRTSVVGLDGLQTNSSLVSTTIIQTGANPRDRALIELDRQRILALQARTRFLLVGP